MGGAAFSAPELCQMPLAGCKSSSSLNFNPVAVIDDGSCICPNASAAALQFMQDQIDSAETERERRVNASMVELARIRRMIDEPCSPAYSVDNEQDDAWRERTWW